MATLPRLPPGQVPVPSGVPPPWISTKVATSPPCSARRYVLGGFPHPDHSGHEQVNVAAPLADQALGGLIRPADAEELGPAGVELDLAVSKQFSLARSARERMFLFADGNQPPL